MKNVLALTILSLLAISCKKEKTITPEQPIPNYSATTTIGSYWVYDRYQVDSTGSETLQSGQDTVRLVGDTLIGNYIYHKYVGTLWMNIQTLSCERDSSGFIVNHYGKILFSLNNSEMLLQSTQDNVYKYDIHANVDEIVSTAFGEKKACIAFEELSRVDGAPVNNCGDPSMKFYTHYVPCIGVTQTETELFSLLVSQCSKKRRKLSSYYIAP